MISRPDPEAWRAIPGWTCTRLREWYDEVAQSMRERFMYEEQRLATPSAPIIVEIGVAYGCSLAYLIARLPERARTVGVDIWEAHQGKEQLDAETWARVTGHGDPLRACCAELARSAAYVFGRTTLVRDTGENAAKLFADESVDVVFVDEHHTRESVGAAIRAWLPKVKRGGYLSGHDCNPHYPGVMQAVTDILPAPWSVRDPHPDDNGWGGVWTWRKPQ